MGCFQSAPSAVEGGKKRTPDSKHEKEIRKQTSVAKKASVEIVEKVKPTAIYVAADPDLGWRRISGYTPSGAGGLIHSASGRNLIRGEYPEPQFWNVGFRNDRNGNIINRVDIVGLALNIAGRAGKLASRFGLQEIDMNDLLVGADGAADVFGRGPPTHALDAWNESVQQSSKKVLKAFGCPDFGWTLLERKTPVEKVGQLYNIRNADEWQQRVQTTGLSPHLQTMRDKNGATVIVDVPEVAMNIAEQLFRLEKSDQNISQRIPTNLFGWRVTHNLSAAAAEQALGADGQLDTRKALAAINYTGDGSDMTLVPVASPDDEAMFLNPETLMMNVASWIQLTYLTSPVF